MKKTEYLVVIGQGPEAFGAYVPDLPGCVAVGGTRDEVMGEIHEAVQSHVAALRMGEKPLPVPASFGTTVAVKMTSAS